MNVGSDASYVVEPSVTVTVVATKTGHTDASEETRTLAVNLTPPSSPGYTVPSSLQVGVAMGALSPSNTSDTDIASYDAADLPAGLVIAAATGVISGTPSEAKATETTATVTVTDTGGNTTEEEVTFPVVSKGNQVLSGFSYSSSSVTYGADEPTVVAPTGAQTSVTYAASPEEVCTVEPDTGALTIVGLGNCEVTASAAGDANYEAAEVTFTVQVLSAGMLSVALETIADDDIVNAAEHGLGFAISGTVTTGGSVAVDGASVTVEVGATELTATTASDGTWSVNVGSDASYVVEPSVAVTVGATKSGHTDASEETRTLAVNLTPPSASHAMVTTAEDTLYTFSADDFGFEDTGGDELASVTVVMPPAVGTLALGDTAVMAEQSVTKAQLDADTLTFTPVANAHGDDYTTFTFRVSDGADDSAAYTMTIDVTPGNDDATGQPAIGGTAQVGEVLSASPGSIDDVDGKTRADNGDAGYAYAYQWFRVDADGTSNPTEIANAISATYTLTSDDVGRKVKVQVSFTDDDGTEETRTGEAYPASATVVGVPGEPQSFEAQARDTEVTLTWSVPASDGGSAVTGYRYRVSADGGTTWNPDWTDVADGADADSDRANETTVTVTGLVNGTPYTFEVRAVNGVGGGAPAGPRTVTPNSATVPPAPTRPTLVSATNKTLTIEWTHPGDGSSPLIRSFVHYRVQGTAQWHNWWPGNTPVTRVTIRHLLANTTYQVRVHATNAVGSSPWSATASEFDTRAANRPATGAPTVTVTAAVGQTLTVDTAGIEDEDGKTLAEEGRSGYAYRYQWARVRGGSGTDIADATGATYEVVAEDAEHQLEVRVNFTDDGDNGETRTSARTEAVPDVDPPGLVSATLQGTALVLLYDEALDESSEPGTDAYAVTATAGTDTTTPELSGVSVNGRKVTLTLAAAPAGDATVTLAYTVPTGTDAMPVQDLSGNDAPAFTGRAVTRGTRLRLADGEAGSPEGRVEIFLDGEWGTICDDSWTDVESDTVCRLLGYEAGSVGNGGRFLEAHFGQGTGPIWLDDVNCDGNEKSLLGCEHTRYTKGQKAQCRHSEDVGVRCRPHSRPRVMEAPVLSAPGTQGWGPGEMLQVKLKFSEKVKVDTTGGMPSVEVMLGSDVMRRATYRSTSETEALVFGYAIVDTDGTHGAVQVMSDSLETRGGRIEGESTGRAAELAHLGASRTMPPPPPAGALTARFEKVPELHRGAGDRFSFEVHFSAEPAGLDYRSMAGPLFRVKGGEVTGARRLEAGSNLAWEVHVEPSVEGDVTVELVPTADCDAEHAVCTAAGDKLLEGVSVLVPGLPAFSVADAEVEEGPGARLDFEVTLSRASAVRVQVRFETADGTARALPGEEAARYAGEGSLEAQRDCARGRYNGDYMAASGQLLFEAGVTARTVSVAVCDDAHDEGSETMRLRLTRVEVVEGIWVSSRIADGEAIGTIRNSDHMPRAWLSRFGRTAAEQVLDAVEGRLSAGRSPGAEVSLIGVRVGGTHIEESRARDAETASTVPRDWLRGDTDEDAAHGIGSRAVTSRAVTGRDFLTGTSFALTGGSDAAGFGALWGQGAISRFDGREDDVTLSGEVRSGMLGADWMRDRATAGLVLSHAQGDGEYRSAQHGGRVESVLTGLYPYWQYEASARLSVGGVAGFGAGRLTLKPEGAAPIETDMDLAMAAANLRGVLVSPPEGTGLELAVTTDGMVVRTTSEEVRGSDGSMAAAQADVTRLRLGVEGSWLGVEAGSGWILPAVEIGVRHDGGDAETGFGADLGAGFTWADPGRGIEAEVSGRGLLTHEDGKFRERGFAGRFAWDPAPSSERGLAFTLSRTAGAAASGGMHALLSRRTMAGLATDNGSGGLHRRRLEAKLGYGFSVLDGRFIGTPEIGLALSDTNRELRVGWRLQLAKRDRADFTLSLEGTRQVSVNNEPAPEHGVGLRLRIAW